jgi:hypothetical protein
MIALPDAVAAAHRRAGDAGFTYSSEPLTGPAGKWTGLDRTIAALTTGGVLLVDDMDPARYTDPGHRATIERIRRTLNGHDALVTTELPVGSGLMVAVHR